MEPNAQGQSNGHSRLNLFLDATTLEHVCHADSIARLEPILSSLSPRKQKNLLRGYRLAAATPLSSILNSLGYNADFLGLEYDDRLVSWLVYRSGGPVVSLLNHITDPNSDLARFCSEIEGLRIALRTSDGGMDQTAEALQKCGVFGGLLRAVLGRHSFVSPHPGVDVSDGGSIFRLLLAERVLDYAWNPGLVYMAIELVWGGEEEAWMPSEESALEVRTHLDYPHSWPSRRSIPDSWNHGLLFGFDSVLRMNGVSLSSHPEPHTGPLDDSKWFSELRGYVNPSFPRVDWPSFKYRLVPLDEFSKETLMAQLPSIGVDMPDRFSARDRLAAILGPDEVRLFTPGTATDFMDLELLLAGAVSTSVDRLVEVLLVTHSVESDNLNWVSVAVRLPRYGLISNHSRWYLFYKMFHEGLVIDSDVDRAIKEVEGLLTRFKDNLTLEEIDGVTDQDLLSHCDPLGFRAMQDLNRRAVDVNSELRAGISELLASYWLQSQGYTNVKVSLKRASLGDSEYDALGVKNGECLVIEVKGGDVVDEDLEVEIAKFVHKLENLQGRLPALSSALGYEDQIDKVSGLFISLADLRGFEVVEDSVELWGYARFVESLKAMGLPTRLTKLLERSQIIRSIHLDGRYFDPRSLMDD